MSRISLILVFLTLTMVSCSPETPYAILGWITLVFVGTVLVSLLGSLGLFLYHFYKNRK